ncbi:ATP-dependent RNA helicase [Striga asiatica]|uniref:ATP-dependent RNA helicase n=1 Tax=Striga asiatica TaxID=4170 RepID=A0A5A7PY91_STRAF|nr:ATP-dependent RNA helicase [Striga asiatica]
MFRILYYFATSKSWKPLKEMLKSQFINRTPHEQKLNTSSEQIFDRAFTLHDRTRPRRHESSRTSLDVALELFRKQQVDFLIATDVTARGLYIIGVQTVINFGMSSRPYEAKKNFCFCARWREEEILLFEGDMSEKRQKRTFALREVAGRGNPPLRASHGTSGVSFGIRSVICLNERV